MTLIGNRRPVRTAPKQRPKAAVHNLSTWRISENATHMFQHCSAKAPLTFPASKAPFHRRPLALAHAQGAPLRLLKPKHPFVPTRIQNIPSILDAPKALHHVRPNQKHPRACQQAPLRVRLNPKPLIFARVQRSPRILSRIRISLNAT